MSRQKKMLSLEVVAAVVLGLAAGVLFIVQATRVTSESTQSEQALYNLLQFVLTVGFAWFSTRAISRREFEHSLRQFAIGAYRRAADTENMLSRLHKEVAEMMTDGAFAERYHLDVVHAIVADTRQVVRSSIADWADVIGPELNKIDTIETLREKRDELEMAALQSDPSSRLPELEKRIDALIADLPEELQVEVRSKAQQSHQDRHAARWVADQHEKDGGLVVMAVAGDDYETDRDCASLESGETLTTLKGERGAVEMVDLQGQVVGRLQNPSPLDYYDFVRALDICYGDGPLDLEVLEVLDEERRRGKRFVWFTARIKSRPVVLTSAERIARLRREEAVRPGAGDEASTRA